MANAITKNNSRKIQGFRYIMASDFLIQLADEEDDRPIWVAAWGSGNTLAQAIWKVEQTRTPEEVKKFLNKFRIYTITDQDMKFDMRQNLAYSNNNSAIIMESKKKFYIEMPIKVHINLKHIKHD